jgi:hypothetical protein
MIEAHLCGKDKESVAVRTWTPGLGRVEIILFHAVPGCAACLAEWNKQNDAALARLAKEKLREQQDFNASVALCCDRCDKVIGYVYVNDLEGSRFYCSECRSGA